MLALIDNYDSFSYNLYQAIGALSREFGIETSVWRNDEVTVSEIVDKKPQAIVISPGPGRPETAGITLDLIGQFKEICPILGVCLGHQAIAQYFGANIVRSLVPTHGKTSKIDILGGKLLSELSSPFYVMRYHSLEIQKESLPSELRVTACTRQGVIMAVEHQIYPIFGVQFHPESFLSEQGDALIKAFLKIVKGS
ncbi:MAG: aminodeoxychorismate/anthranilate synthase component II [Bdellovibrionales bacterium]|nr:aminodeoxychorismate/anthranilate synthase component II [Bdellovibrionales bacterium]